MIDKGSWVFIPEQNAMYMVLKKYKDNTFDVLKWNDSEFFKLEHIDACDVYHSEKEYLHKMRKNHESI